MHESRTLHTRTHDVATLEVRCHTVAVEKIENVSGDIHDSQTLDLRATNFTDESVTNSYIIAVEKVRSQ